MNLSLVLLFMTHAYSFTLVSGEPKFPTSEVIVDVSSNSCSNIGLSSEDLLQLAEEAADEYWNKVPTCALELKRGSVKGVDVSSEDPGTQAGANALYSKAENNHILIGCNSNATLFPANSSTLAVGTIYTASAGVRGVVLINNTATTPFNRMDQREKWATLAHEIGHAFGLGHSSDPIALMYYATGAKIQERLTIDDYDGCSYLYPHESPGSCNSVAITSGSGQDQNRANHLVWSYLLGTIFILSISKFWFKNRLS